MRVTYHVATSADMFIARQNGDVSWLEQIDIDMEATGLVQFMTEIDGIAMGRNTYDFVFSSGTWPYGDTPGWIFTSRAVAPLADATLHQVTLIQDLIASAKNAGIKHLWLVGGGQLASAFLEENLITDICITKLQVELESGIPLFSRHQLADIAYEIRTEERKDGFTAINYQLKAKSGITMA